MSSPSTEELIAWDRAFLWHPFTPMKPWIEQKDFVVIERGEREFLFDTEGRKYIDGTSSLWCNVHGHGVPEIDAAVIGQLGKVAHSTLLGMANVPSILLAKKLVAAAAAADMDLPRVFYSDNGSTAVEVACKMAFQYWKNIGTTRWKFLALNDAYHGDTLGAVSVGGIPLFHNAFRGLTFPVDFMTPPEAAQGEAELLRTIATLDHRLEMMQGMYAAIIVEPLVQGAGGMKIHAAGFLRELRRLADKHNILLIADEVLTGFGRTGTMFACEQESVTPDFLCLSKGLTGGYMPMGVTMTSQKVFDAFYADPREGKTFFHGHTYTGHPLACAAALASIELIESTKLLDHVRALEPILQEMLDAARGLPWVHEVRRAGLIGAIELRYAAGQPYPAHYRVGGAVCRHMRDYQPIGLLTRPLADTVVIMPPLAITAENLRYLCKGVLHSLGCAGEIVAGITQTQGGKS